MQYKMFFWGVALFVIKESFPDPLKTGNVHILYKAMLYYPQDLFKTPYFQSIPAIREITKQMTLFISFIWITFFGDRLQDMPERLPWR